jgi:uncharacterized membrane protein SpoIIM required for sporulation
MAWKAAHTTNKKGRHLFSLNHFAKLTIGFFLFGFTGGFLAAHLLRNTLYAPSLSLFQNTLSSLSSLAIDRNDVFLYSMKENVKFFLLFFFFALTNVWRLYYACSTIYSGFSYGLLCAFCILLSGTGGIVEFFCFLLPQALLLIPAYLLAVCSLERLHKGWFSKDYSETSSPLFLHPKRRQLLFASLPSLFFCIILLLLASLIEGYLNIPLLKYYHAKTFF